MYLSVYDFEGVCFEGGVAVEAERYFNFPTWIPSIQALKPYSQRTIQPYSETRNEMDASALSMVMERQETIRGAYNQYRHEFQAGPSRGRARTWAWGRLDEKDIQELVETTLNAEWEPHNKEPDAYERKRRERHRQRVKKWVITYLEDSGKYQNIQPSTEHSLVSMPKGLALTKSDVLLMHLY